MQITYRNHFWDLFWFNLYQIPRSRTWQIIFLLLLLFFAKIAFDFMTDDKSQFSVLVRALSALTIILGNIVVMSAIVLAMISINIFTNRQTRRVMNNDCNVSVLDESVLMESSTSRSEVKWSGIEKVARTSKYILINLSDQMACVIPKRAFPDGSSADKFFDLAYDRWNNAKDQ